jgi:hypothetical protein
VNRREIFGQLLGIGQDILASAYSAITDALLVQLGDQQTAISDIDEAEWVQHTGFWSRPASPTTGAGGGACQAYAVRNGDRDIVFASRDLRSAKVPGMLNPGDTCAGSTNPVFATNAKTTWGADGSWKGKAATTATLSTPGGSVAVAQNGNVSVGPNPTDGIVLQTKLATQLSALSTWAQAMSAAIASATPASGITPAQQLAVANALTAFTNALGQANYSATCTASQ